MAIINRVADFHEEMSVWRRTLHTHPEIGYEEEWTSDFIAEKLKSFGLEIHRGLAKTAVIGILKGKTDSGRHIGLRADMDGLPMPETNEFDHKSQNEGRMHACGHDGHMTMLLGAARYLAETRNFDGTVYFIFQPAEEGGAGAQTMIKEGLFEQFDVESVWGMHNWPGLATGDIAVCEGACMASADQFTITIIGRGSHAAMPHQSVDPVLTSAQIIQGLQSIVSRKTNPLDAAVVSITMVHGGSAFNVIPDKVELTGTARAILPETRNAVAQSIHNIASSIAMAYGCTAEVNWQDGYPPTVNYKLEAGRAAEIARSVVGADRVHLNLPPSMGAEDFSFMLESRPGAYIWLGAGEARTGQMLHNTGYDFNDEILPVGTSYWAKLVETELALS